MGTITGTQIANRARRVLQDTTPGGTRWLDAELLDWINDAQREAVNLKPSAYSEVTDRTLVAGTKQTLPTGGICLLSIVRNVGGKAVRRVDRNILDSENPDWHTATASATVEHYVFDEDAPDTFWVYPPQPGSGMGAVQIIHSKAPADLGSLASTITLNDMYANAILDYVLYRAYSKDTDYAGNLQRASNHMAAFGSSLGVKIQNALAYSPNENVSTARAPY